VGICPEEPVKSAQEQKWEVVARWLTVEYPQIVKKAKKEKAKIYWGDETGIQNEANRMLGYAPRGTAPVLKIPAKKEHVSMISAITNEGKIRFMIYRESLTADHLIIFMKRLIKDTRRKVYLILDNLRTHHSKRVSLWLEAKKDEIEVFYLPAYSPELNPDEYLNNGLKQKVHSDTQAKTTKDLKHKTESFMRTLLRRPHQVMKYFEHPAVAYAA
jgi:transposase